MSAVVDVKAVVRLGTVRDMFGRLQRLNIRKVFGELRKPARVDQNQHWRALQAPDGKWPPLAPSTVERRTRPRGRDKNGRNRSWPKRLLGRFPTSLQMLPSQRSLIVRSRIKKFDWIHQAGGIAGHGARIPRRQYLWISNWLLKETKLHFERALRNAAIGRP